MENREGMKLPNIVFRARKDGDWNDISSDALFQGRKVIVFALPGAFTPTCSTTHLPRYDELAPVFKANGVDEIVCLSVNDGFVMEAWAKDQKAENITMLPDGNGAFSTAVGMLVDKSDLGFGPRSWRYSMLVNDGVIEKMFIEPNKPGDPFEVSDADTMLNYIAPDAKLPEEVTLFSKPGCPFCLRAKALLNAKGMRYEAIELGSGVSYKSLRNITGRSTAPQVYIGGKHIGDLEALEAYFNTTS